jgi:hypothetical protein
VEWFNLSDSKRFKRTHVNEVFDARIGNPRAGHMMKSSPSPRKLQLSTDGHRCASSSSKTPAEAAATRRWRSTDYRSASGMDAFEMPLCELGADATPHEGRCGASGNTIWHARERSTRVRPQLRSTFSADCPQQIRELATRCLSR